MSLSECCSRFLPILTTLSLLAGNSSAVDKPVWRFSILASIDEAFVEQFGGLDKCDSLIRYQLDSINHMYNDPGVFDGIFDFYLDSFQSFSQSGFTQSHLPHPDQDYHIVYDFDTRTLSNWLYPPYNAVLFRTYSTDNIPFPFFTPGHILLAHELAHSRGAVDLYGLEVDWSFNQVNSTNFTMSKSYMNDLMSQVWDEFTILVVNKQGGYVLSLARFRLAIFPDLMLIRAVDSLQKPVADATIRIYGHTWYNMSLTDNILAEGTTDSLGNYVLSEDIFIGSDSINFCPNTLCIKYPTLLLEMERDNHVQYAWLPFTEPQIHKLDGTPDPFIKTVELPINMNEPPLPKGFVLKQNYPNPFNSRTSVCVTLAKGGSLRVEISNVLGQTEAVLFNGEAPSGTTCLTWDGNAASSGVYFCRAKYFGQSHAVKMLLLK